MKSKALDRLIEFAQRRIGTAVNGHGVDDLVRKAYALGRKESGKQAAECRAALAKIGSEVDRIAHGKQDEVCDDFTAGYADGCTAISYHIEEIVTIALAQPVSSVGGRARNAERT